MTPALVPADDGAAMRHVLVYILTLLVFLVRVVQLGWILGAVVLLIAGVGFAIRHRRLIFDYLTALPIFRKGAI